MALSRALKRRSSPAIPLVLLVVLSLVPCLVYLAAGLYFLDGTPALPLDDSWIHLAFARNLAGGQGLSLNPGEMVAGSTAPLWTGLLALMLLPPGDPILWILALGVLLHLLVVVLVWSLVRTLGGGSGLAFVAGLLTLLTGRLVWASLSGMEVSLFTALSLAGTALHLRERREPDRPVLSLGVFGVAALARPEGLLLIVLAAADRLFRFRRGPGGELAMLRPRLRHLRRLGGGVFLAASAVLPVAGFYLWIGGSPIPTTLAAKSGGGGGVHLPELQYVGTALPIFLEAAPWMLALAPVGGATLVAHLGGPGDRGLLPLLWPLGLVAAYASLTAPESPPLVGNFGRYLYPLLPFVIVLGAIGLEPIAQRLVGPRPQSSLRRGLVGVAIALLLAPSVSGLARTAGFYVRNLADVEAGDVRMARWLSERLPPQAVVATMDVGAMAAILPNRVIDLAGIGDPEVHEHIARAEARGESWQAGVLDFLAEKRPDYLMVFPRWLPAAVLRGSRFERLHTVRVPDNVTLGQDTLAVYSTPWTRVPLREPAEPGTRP